MNVGSELTHRSTKNNACASSIGDIIFLRDPPTTSEVLEEWFHFEQALRGDYIDEEPPRMRLLREIDAHEFLLSVTDRFHIPDDEVEHTIRNMWDYKEQLRMLDEGLS